MGSRVAVTNTPWHREDLTYHLENEAGWPTLTMDAYGFVRVSNADAAWQGGDMVRMLRPSETRIGGAYQWYRLRAHDPDPDEQTTLFPERFSRESIAEMRRRMTPREFSQALLCDPLTDDSARCQRDWIERCKLRGLGSTLVPSYSGNLRTFTGVDLAIGQGRGSDKTVLFTILIEDDGTRRILDIESGRFAGPEIVKKIIDKGDRYGSKITVESNSAQDYLRQFALQTRADLQIKAHTTTGKNKRDRDWGVESIFTEIENGAWVIPCDTDGKCLPVVQAWIDDMLFYQPPPAHSGDYLMASWLAREAAHRGAVSSRPHIGKTRAMVKELARGGSF
jgi:hypothetical protein